MPEYFGLAGDRDVGTMDPSHQLFAGEAPVVTDSAESDDTVARYEVVCLLDTGHIRTWAEEDVGANCVITAIAGADGDRVPYYSAGRFNHAVLVWPEDLDTYDKRRAFFAGTDIHMGHLNP